MSSKAQEEFAIRCKKFFDDMNGGQPILVTQLNAVIQKVDPDWDGNVVEVFAELDDNGDMKVSWEEFSEELLKQDPRKVTKSVLKVKFEELDNDGSNTLNREEVKAMFTELEINVSEDSLTALIDAADTSGDGKISYKEFVDSWFNAE